VQYLLGAAGVMAILFPYKYTLAEVLTLPIWPQAI
jgi:hypothetical protein